MDRTRPQAACNHGCTFLTVLCCQGSGARRGRAGEGRRRRDLHAVSQGSEHWVERRRGTDH
jgi:hypothetical protein